MRILIRAKLDDSSTTTNVELTRTEVYSVSSPHWSGTRLDHGFTTDCFYLFLFFSFIFTAYYDDESRHYDAFWNDHETNMLTRNPLRMEGISCFMDFRICAFWWQSLQSPPNSTHHEIPEIVKSLNGTLKSAKNKSSHELTDESNLSILWRNYIGFRYIFIDFHSIIFLSIRKVNEAVLCEMHTSETKQMWHWPIVSICFFSIGR